MTITIPQADYAIIGGSSTFSLNFPEDLGYPGLEVLATGLVFSTPYGESPAFKLFRIGDKQVLTLKMHGWRPGVNRGDASRQVFWVFREAGVRRIMAEGGAGSINHLLRPRDLVIPSDYIDNSMRKDVGLDGGYLLIMRQAVCPEIHRFLVKVAEATQPGRRVFDRGNYVVTDGRHFESPAEVAAMRLWNGDIVGQSMCPEVYLAREIGACYARIDLVVNYAEGVVRDWEHEELKDIFYNEGQVIGNILLGALDRLSISGDCGCSELRKPTLLKDSK